MIATPPLPPGDDVLAPADSETPDETLDVLAEPHALEAIRAAEADYAAGRFLNAEQVRARYGIR